MSQDGRRNQGMPLGAVVRPVVMLVAGVAASAVLWHVLMLGPGAGGQGRATERLSHRERAALWRLLHQPRATP